MYTVALKHLKKIDPVLRQLIKRVGPCLLEPQRQRTPFESLVRAIAHQQLHGTAAERILGRFIGLFAMPVTAAKITRRTKKAAPKFPLPEQVLAQTLPNLRSVGFSGAKAIAIRDLAEKTLAGTVPTSRQITRLEDEAIIDRITQVRGIGRWTVEMLLIFRLGRLDVLPADDFGVKNGYQIAYELPEMPSKKELLAAGEIWRPYRSIAAWYLWRAADLDKAKRKKADKK